MRRQLLDFFAGDLAALARDPLTEFCRRSSEAEIVKLHVGSETCHLISSPHAIKHILLANAFNYDKNTAAFMAVRLLLGNGLLTSSGHFWLRQRRVITPAFKAENMRYFLPILQRQAIACAKRWSQAALRGEEVNASNDFNLITLMAVAESLFSDDLADYTDVISEEFPIILECLAQRVASPIRFPLWLPTQNNRRLAPSIRRLRSIAAELIARRRRKLESSQPGSLDQADLLTQLICRRDPLTNELMSDRQISDEVMTLLVAGHETTANALCWLFILLHDYPKEQERLRHEIAGHSDCSGSFTLEQLINMPRCRAVIQEVLRLYPPVWLFSRRALSDDAIGDYRILKGDIALFCPYALHRLPSLWPNPDLFNPDRFINPHDTHHNDFTYLPFGAGKRSCLGAGFAMIEAQVILATLLRSFEFSVVDRELLQPLPMMTLRTSQPIRLHLRALFPVS